MLKILTSTCTVEFSFATTRYDLQIRIQGLRITDYSFTFARSVESPQRAYVYSTVTITKMYQCLHVLYSGKFSYGANFRIFRMLHLYVKIKTMKKIFFFCYMCDL